MTILESFDVLSVRGTAIYKKIVSQKYYVRGVPAPMTPENVQTKSDLLDVPIVNEAATEGMIWLIQRRPIVV